MYRIIISLFLTLLSIAYPLVWLFDSEQSKLSYLSFGLALLWFLRAWQVTEFKRYFALLMSALLIFISFTRSLEMMYWYPVLINLVMLIAFGSSLWAKQSLVERLARLQTADLPPQAIGYTRKVTQLWCLVFILNLIVCITLILIENYHYWALYTGIISYLIIGLVMAGEYCVRRQVMKKQ